MSRRLPPPAQVLLCCALSLLVMPGLAAAKRSAPPLETMPEWVHLSIVWNALTDHSSGQIFSQQRLHELVPEIDRTEGDLGALVARKALPADTAAVFRTVLQERYRYVEEHCYGSAPRSELTPLEGAEAASRWIIEMQLDLLQQPLAAGSLSAGVPQPDQKLQQAVQTSLTNELSFLWQCRSARGDRDGQQKELDDKETQGRKVDRSRSDMAWVQRQQALVDAYQQHRIRADRGIERLVPYLVRLSLTPAPTPRLDETAQPPLFPY